MLGPTCSSDSRICQPLTFCGLVLFLVDWHLIRRYNCSLGEKYCSSNVWWIEGDFGGSAFVSHLVRRVEQPGLTGIAFLNGRLRCDDGCRDRLAVHFEGRFPPPPYERLNHCLCRGRYEYGRRYLLIARSIVCRLAFHSTPDHLQRSDGLRWNPAVVSGSRDDIGVGGRRFR